MPDWCTCHSSNEHDSSATVIATSLTGILVTPVVSTTLVLHQLYCDNNFLRSCKPVFGKLTERKVLCQASIFNYRVQCFEKVTSLISTFPWILVVKYNMEIERLLLKVREIIGQGLYFIGLLPTKWDVFFFKWRCCHEIHITFWYIVFQYYI